jgi:uncharacterized protein YsxB (DUF464 family)
MSSYILIISAIIVLLIILLLLLFVPKKQKSVNVKWGDGYLLLTFSGYTKSEKEELAGLIKFEMLGLRNKLKEYDKNKETKK